MIEHSPTPWHVFKDDFLIVCFGEGDSICDCAPGSPFISFAIAEANAAFIVKAVNNHEALAKALEGIAEFCSADGSTLGAIDRLASIRNTAINVLRHVGRLDKTEGGQ